MALALAALAAVEPACGTGYQQVGRGPEAELVALWGLRPGGIRSSLGVGLMSLENQGEGKKLSRKGKGNGFRRKDHYRRCCRRRLSAARCDYSGLQSLVSVQTHPPRSLVKL
ncbi:hypothetical protein NN561_011090 [Cricetulus griseus]